MNKQRKEYTNFAKKIIGVCSEERESYLGLEQTIFTIKKDILKKNQSIIFTITVSRVAYHENKYSNKVKIFINNIKLKSLNLHIKKNHFLKRFFSKQQYKIVNGNILQASQFLVFLNKTKYVNEIVISSDENTYSVEMQLTNKYLEENELIDIYENTIELTKTLKAYNGQSMVK